jgi:predicted permease
MPQIVRSLAKNPGFTIVAVLTLALGIGANTAVFSVVNAVLLRPLPYPNAERIVQIWRVTPQDRSENMNAPDYLEYGRANSTLSTIAGYREDPTTIAVAGRDPIGVTGAEVTVEFFDVFGMPAVLGRTFNTAAGDGRSEPRVVLGHALWRDLLGSDPAVIGRDVRINGRPHTIVGVMPAAFDVPQNARAWFVSSKPVPLPPMDVEGDITQIRDVSYFNTVALLKPGVTAAQANADIARIASGIAEREPRASSSGARVERLHDQIVGDVRTGLLLLFGAVGLVLLIACANVASLLLARASGRQRELAVRAALGASRGRLVRHLLTESAVLAAAGGALGLFIGMWTVGALVSLMPSGMPRTGDIGLDPRVAFACLLVSVLSALLFGLLPSLQASRAEAAGVLREGGDRGSTGGRRRARTRSVLVVAEIALTLMLLVTAGLLGNSFLRLQRTDSGFALDRVTLAETAIPAGKYADSKQQAAFYERLLDVFATRGEIASSAVAFPRPFGGGTAGGSFYIEGRPLASAADRPNANIAAVSPDYFRTLGIPLLAGRDLTPQDRDPAPAAVIINSAFARRYLPDVDPLGKRIRFDDAEDDWITIVGVVADTRASGLAIDPRPTIYLSFHTFTLPFMSVLVKSDAGDAAVAAAVRAAYKEVDPEIPVGRIRTMNEVLASSVAEPRFRTYLLGAFAGTALLLAVIGVYGLVSYSVSQRTREIGIRVALGASSSQVIGPIVRHGMILALIGVGLGLVGAVFAGQVVASFLYGVQPTDPLTFTAVAVLLLAVAFVASYLPSRRALRVDPLTALRAE